MKHIAVVGGGIVGLAIAYKLSLMKEVKVSVFEKESSQGQHQSGNNSGVLHCGLSYTPNSLKAKLAVNGIKQMVDFCVQNYVKHDICGQVVVATNDEEVKTLDNIAARGKANGLQGLKYLSRYDLKQREPHVKAKKALLVPEEGIVDYKGVMQKMVDKIKESGNEIFFNSKVQNIEETDKELILKVNDKEYKFDLLISCTGLYADMVYQNLTGNKRPLRIVPFRGEYMKIKSEYKDLVNHLIYPVPNPKYPFLGVHFTRMINESRELGPNAVFALKREAYTNKDISLSEFYDSISYKGFHKFVLKNFKFALGEFASSMSNRSFLKKAKRLVPDIELNMIERGVAGVRAQAMNTSGKLIMDFKIEKVNKQIHVLNAPSPAATSSLAIADYVIENYVG